MKFILIFLSLFVFEISLAQENVQEPISEDEEVRYCPKDPDMDTIEKMIENYIEAKKLGHTTHSFNRRINPECLETELPYPYKVITPKPAEIIFSRPTNPFFVTNHKIKSIRKSRSSEQYDEYIAELEIKGNDISGNNLEYEDRVSFEIYKGGDRKLFGGCITNRGGWTKSLIYKRCYPPYAPPYSLAFKTAVAPQINTQLTYNCPQDPDMATARKMVENYIEAKKLGHMLSSSFNFVKQECYDTKLPYPYKVVLPKPLDKSEAGFYLSYNIHPYIFITDHKIKSLRKTSSANYIADIEIKGKDQWGNNVEYERKNMIFYLYKGEDADLYGGCIDAKGLGSFIYEKCYVKVPLE